MMTNLYNSLEHTKANAPLVHSLTNAISINDCANAILAIGGKPIMAEHPKEVAEITAIAKSLYINLGNITDSRMEAMLISGAVAKEKNIPILVDLVGIGCSKLRLDFAKELIAIAHPQVLKGNISEIKALVGTSNASGIDAGISDVVTENNLAENAKMMMQLAGRLDAIIVATGKIDLIAATDAVYAIQNGCPMLSQVTGTGCMLGAIMATYSSARNPIEGAILGTLVMGIAGELGELSQTAAGTGSFRVSLMDAFSNMTPEHIKAHAKLERIV